MTTGGFPRCMKIRLTYSENSRKQGHNFPYWYTSGSVSSRHTGTKITFGVSNFNVSTFNLCGVFLFFFLNPFVFRSVSQRLGPVVVLLHV